MKKAGAEIVQAPSTAKLDDMVGKNTATNYEFPDNGFDSDKVRAEYVLFGDTSLNILKIIKGLPSFPYWPFNRDNKFFQSIFFLFW